MIQLISIVVVKSKEERHTVSGRMNAIVENFFLAEDCPIARLSIDWDHTEDRGACNYWPQQAGWRGEDIAAQKSVLHCKHLEEDMMCGIGLRDKFMVGWTDVCDRRWQLGDGRSSSYCDNWPLGPHMTIGHRDRTYCINIQYSIWVISTGYGRLKIITGSCPLSTGQLLW